MMKPWVSIIIPCYNHAEVVKRMLDSIVSQTYPAIEVIVVNDGSTDASEEVILSCENAITARGFKFCYVKQENAGLGAAINAGLARLTGDFFCWADADDYYETTSVERRVTALQERPDYAVVTSNAYVRQWNNLEEKHLEAADNAVNNDPHQFLYHLNGDSIFCAGSHLVRTAMFREVYPDMAIYPARRGQNWQLLLPLYFKFKRYFLNEPLYNIVVYPNSMSKDRNSPDDRIRRFNEHETILNEVLNHIEQIEKVDVTQYRRFLDDKYAKLRMEVYLKFDDKMNFCREYIKKQHNVGIDLHDRIAWWRMKSKVFRKLCHYAYRILRGGSRNDW